MVIMVQPTNAKDSFTNHSQTIHQPSAVVDGLLGSLRPGNAFGEGGSGATAALLRSYCEGNDVMLQSS